MARTQQERRETTRTALLDAAAACLLDDGLAGFTTAAVASRAGLSNGALFRHFPSRADLLAATAAHVLTTLRLGYEAGFAALPGGRRTAGELLELLWAAMSAPELGAVFELYTAARTDPWMQAALTPVVRDHVAAISTLAEDVVADLRGGPDPELADAVHLAICAMQGLVVNLMACPDPDAVARLLRTLTRLADAGPLAPTTPTTTTGRRTRPSRPHERT